MASVNQVSVPTCRVVRPGEAFQGKQGLMYSPAISAESVGSQGIHMQLLTIPPGGRAKAHKHEAHETAIYVTSGEAGMWYGERLEHHMVTRAGDFVYIPANMPHLPYNRSQTEPATAIVARKVRDKARIITTEETVAVISRTDPNEQESVVMLPELDAIHA